MDLSRYTTTELISQLLAAVFYFLFQILPVLMFLPATELWDWPGYCTPTMHICMEPNRLLAWVYGLWGLWIWFQLIRGALNIAHTVDDEFIRNRNRVLWSLIQMLPYYITNGVSLRVFS